MRETSRGDDRFRQKRTTKADKSDSGGDRTLLFTSIGGGDKRHSNGE